MTPSQNPAGSDERRAESLADRIAAGRLSITELTGDDDGKGGVVGVETSAWLRHQDEELIVRALRALSPASDARRTNIVTCCVTGAIPGDGGACGDCDPCILGESSVPAPVKRLIAEKNSLLNQVGELSDKLATMEEEAAPRTEGAEVAAWREALLRIAFQEDINDLTGNASKWSCNVAYCALGGRIQGGVRLDDRTALSAPAAPAKKGVQATSLPSVGSPEAEIVARLRSEAVNWSRTCGGLFDEAADLIVRLREEISSARCPVPPRGVVAYYYSTAECVRDGHCGCSQGTALRQGDRTESQQAESPIDPSLRSPSRSAVEER